MYQGLQWSTIMKQRGLFGPKTIKFEDIRLGFNSVRYHCGPNAASYAAIFWLLDSCRIPFLHMGVNSIYDMWWVKWISLDSLHTKNTFGCVNIGQQERDIVFSDVKRTDSVQARSLGRGWEGSSWKGKHENQFCSVITSPVGLFTVGKIQ